MARKRDRPYGLDVTPIDPLATLFHDEAIAVAELVAIDDVQVAQQPRRYFDPEKQASLLRSIRAHGILEPLIVRPRPGATPPYELVAGERRYRAAKELGLDTIPAVIRTLSDADALQISLLENLQRDDLNPLDETEGILQLLALRLEISVEEVPILLYQMKNSAERRDRLTKAKAHRAVTLAKHTGDDTSQPDDDALGKNHHNPAIATTVSKTISKTSSETGSERILEAQGQGLSRVSEAHRQIIETLFEELGRMTWMSFICNRLPLLNLDPEILAALRTGKLAYTKAMVIARVDDPDLRQSVLQDTLDNNLSLQKIRDRIRTQAAPPPPPKWAALQERFKRLYQKGTQSSALDNATTRAKVTRLLAELEALLEE